MDARTKLYEDLYNACHIYQADGTMEDVVMLVRDIAENLPDCVGLRFLEAWLKQEFESERAKYDALAGFTIGVGCFEL